MRPSMSSLLLGNGKAQPPCYTRFLPFTAERLKIESIVCGKTLPVSFTAKLKQDIQSIANAVHFKDNLYLSILGKLDCVAEQVVYDLPHLGTVSHCAPTGRSLRTAKRAGLCAI